MDNTKFTNKGKNNIYLGIVVMFIMLFMIGNISAITWEKDGVQKMRLEDTTGNLEIAGNFTLADKITFAFGEAIDNILDGWIGIIGSLNVTNNISLGGSIIQDGYRIASIENNSIVVDKLFSVIMNGSTGIESPHLYLQPGGDGQFSGVVRTLGIVNENITFLNNVENRTVCQAYFDFVNETLQIDCNTSTTGADLFVSDDMQVIGDVWLKDTDDEWHFSSRDIAETDHLQENIFLGKNNLTLDRNLTISNIDNQSIVVNINSINFFVNINESIEINSGSNSTPTRNYISFQESGGTAILVNDASLPTTINSAEVARVIRGGELNDYLYADIPSLNKELFTNIFARANIGFEQYVSGFSIDADATDINFTEGEFWVGMKKHTCNSDGIGVVNDGFYIVHANGTFEQCTDFSCIDEYAGGETIGVNAYFNVVWALVPSTDTECRLIAIPQQAPSSKYTSALRAESDLERKLTFIFNDDEINTHKLILSRTILFEGNDQQQTFVSGLFYETLIGIPRAGAAAAGTNDHSLLSNLLWSVSGHTFDTNIDLNNFNITEVQSLIFSNNELIDNLVDGWIRITGNLNMNGNNITNISSLGIGTDDPREALEVIGNANITGEVSIRDSNDTDSNGTLYLGHSSTEGQQFIKYNSDDDIFEMTAKIKIPAKSPAIIFFDEDDPDNVSKQRSIEFNPDTLELLTGDVFQGSYGDGDGLPPANKTFFRIGPLNLSSGSEEGTFLGFNTHDSFDGDLVNFQVGNTSRLKFSNKGDLLIDSGTRQSIAPLIKGIQKWDNAAEEFAAFEIEIDDIASASDSKLVDLKVDMVSKFVVGKDGSVGIGLTNPENALHVNGTIIINEGLNVSGNVDIGKNLTVANNTLFVNSDNKRIGIGTTSPDAELHISQTGNPLTLLIERTDGVFLNFLVEEFFSSIAFGDGGSFNIGPVNAIGVEPNESQILEIGSTGNVGIGISGTSSKLEVAGNTTITGRLNVTEDTIIFGDLSVNNSDLFVDVSTGRVGIGTLIPVHDLDIEDTSSAASLRLTGAGANVVHQVNQEYDINYARDSGNAIIDFRAISSDGTSGAFYRFGLQSGSSGANSITLFDNNGTDQQARISSSGLNTFFNAIGGNLGIGTNSPKAKLEVNGSVLVNEDLNVTMNAVIQQNITVGDAIHSGAARIDLAKYVMGTGILSGGLISNNASNSSILDVTAGVGIFVNHSNTTDPVVEIFTWEDQTFYPNVNGFRSKLIAFKGNSSEDMELVAQFDFTQEEKRTVAILGRCISTDGLDTCNVPLQLTTPAFGDPKSMEDLFFALGSINIDGNVFSANGSNLILDRSGGNTFRFSGSFRTNPLSPNVFFNNASIGITNYAYHLQNSTQTISRSAIDPDNYDVGGVLTPVPANRWTIQEVWFFPVSRTTHVIYGQDFYSSQGDAIAAIGAETKIRNEEILDGAIKRNYLIVQQGAIELNDEDQATFLEADLDSAGGTFFWERDDEVIRPAEFGDSVELGGNFSVNGTFRVDIDNGFVGIGTTSPSEKLEVNGRFLQPVSNLSLLGGINDSTNLDALFDVQVISIYAYAVAFGDDSMRVIDVADPTNLSIVGGVKDATNLDGASGIFVFGDYAYVTAFNNARLNIIDITDHTNPVSVGSVRNTSLLSGAEGVHVIGNYAYVSSFTDNSLTVVDVSDPTSPIIVGNVSGISGAREVYVENSFAYVTSFSGNSLKVVDVTDVTNPTIVGSVGGLSGARGVYVKDKYAYVASTGSDRMSIIDVSNVSNPVIVSSVTDSSLLNGAIEVQVSGKYAYVAAQQDNSVRVIDVSNVSNPFIVGGIKDGTNLNSIFAIYVHGNFVYAVMSGSDSLQVIDTNSGINTPTAFIGHLEIDHFLAKGTAHIASELSIGEGLFVGSGGIGTSGDLTIGQRIIFAFGEVIDNIEDGWIRITGNLNVTAGNITLDNGAAIITGSGAFIGSGSGGATPTVKSTTNSNNFIVANASDDTLLIVDQDGDVGIGTASPSAELHVSQTGNASSLIVERTGGKFAELLSGTSFSTIGFGNNSRLQIGPVPSIGSLPSDSSSLVISSSGDVGIGTTSPDAKLEVAGNIHVQGLEGSYSNGEAYVCVFDNGTIFAKDSACS